MPFSISFPCAVILRTWRMVKMKGGGMSSRVSHAAANFPSRARWRDAGGAERGCRFVPRRNRGRARFFARIRHVGKLVDRRGFSSNLRLTDIVSSELLAPPSAQERRRLDRSLCAELLDPLLRRLARQEALCRRVLGRLARAFLHL